MFWILLYYILLCMVALLLPLWFIRFHLKRKRLYELASKMNGPSTLPIFGNALNCLIPHDKTVNAILDAIKYYKSPTRFWFGPHLAVHIWDPKNFEIVLNSSQCLGKDSYMYGFAEGALFGKGLLTLPVEPWKRHRRMIAPAFNQKNLECFFDAFRKQSNNLVKELKVEVGKGVFDFEKYVARATMEAVLETILNFGGTKTSPNIVEFLEWLEELQNTASWRITKPWLYADFIFNRTAIGKRFNKIRGQFDSYIDSVMEDWKQEVLKKQLDDEETVEESVRSVKFVEHLLSISDEGQKFTAQELRDEVKTIIISGMETTTGATGFTLLALGMYPQVQQKLYEDIIELLGTTREVQYEDLKQLEYLDRVIKESLRLFPSGAGFSRCSDQEIQLDKHTIPAGCTILLDIFGLHRDPNIWPNPTKFDPDRFLPEEVAKRHPYSWMPFSAGPRNCIGYRYAMLELKTFITALVRNYEITTTYQKPEDVDLKWLFVFKPSKGYNVCLKSRT